MSVGEKANDFEKKRQLSFLTTFDRKFGQFRKELERLRRAAGETVPPGGKWPTEGLERNARSLVGAGAVYGLPEVAEWARDFSWKLDAIRNETTPPSNEDLAWLDGRIGDLETICTEAAARLGGPAAEDGAKSTETASSSGDVARTEPAPVASGVYICVKDANVRKKIAFALKGENIAAVEIADPASILDRVQMAPPELLIVDLDDRAPFGSAVIAQLTLFSLSDRVPVLKVATGTGGERWDIVPKPVENRALIARVRELTRPGAVGLTGLRDGSVRELLDAVAGELRTGLLDAARGEQVMSVFRLTDPGALMRDLLALTASLRRTAFTGSGGRIRFAPVRSGRTVFLILGEGDILEPLEPEHPDLAAFAGMRAVVAASDARVRILLDTALSGAGVKVRTAVDGAEALEAIEAGAPDVVLFDLAMSDPGGFALSGRLSMDYRLRDIPVILLSGSGGGKEEVQQSLVCTLRPRLMLHRLLSAPGEVAGRLESIGILPLLRDVAARRADCQLLVHESWNDFDVSIREGRISAVTMTNADGSFASGGRALDRLMGIESGRFEVRPSSGNVRPQFTGTVREVLDEACGRLNRMVDQVRGGALMRINGLTFDDEAWERCTAALPSDLRTALKALKAGTKPIDVLSGGELTRGGMERLLLELIRSGAVVALDAPDPLVPRAAVARNTIEWTSVGAGAPDDQQTAGEETTESTTTDTVSLELADISVMPAPHPGMRTTAPPALRPSLPAPVLRRKKQEKVLIATVVILSLALLVLGGLTMQKGLFLKPSGPPAVTDVTPAPAPEEPAPAPEEPAPAPEEPAPPPEEPAPPPEEPAPVVKKIEKKKEERGTLNILAPSGNSATIEVLVDGRRKGAIPATLSLSPGLHEITFIRGGQRTIRMVSIKEGVTKEVTPSF